MSLPLSKTLDLADFDQLIEELQVVDAHFMKGLDQHPMRRWEYALALRAWRQWRALQPTPRPNSYDDAVDVGGAGSPFALMLASETTSASVDVVDSAGSMALGGRIKTIGMRLDQYLQLAACLTHAVFCLSVLEHVEDLDQFLYHLGCLVAPGGLLFLTMDCRESESRAEWPPPFPHDDRHFHWMRRRIFTPQIVNSLLPFHFAGLGFGMFGEYEQGYHGHQLFASYSFASLALVKRA